MKRSNLAMIIALGSICSTTADAALPAPEDVPGYNHEWGVSVVGSIREAQELADKTNIMANDNADRIQLLEDEPKPIDGKDGLNGTNGKDGAVGATGAAGLNGTDHHNDVAVQKNTAAVSQNTQRLSTQDARISTLASQGNH